MWKDIGTAALGIVGAFVLVAVLLVMLKLGQPIPPNY